MFTNLNKVIITNLSNTLGLCTIILKFDFHKIIIIGTEPPVYKDGLDK